MNQPSIFSSVTLLGAIVTLFCFALSAVNAVTAPRIAAYTLMRKERTAQQSSATVLLKPFFPEATSFEKIGSTKFHDSTANYYRVSKDQEIVGYGIDAFGEGIESIIHAIVGVHPDYSIKAVRVLYQNETEGMGTLIVATDFLKQFSGKNADRLHVITEGDTTDAIMAITGATISSMALAEDAVRSSVLFLKSQGIR